MDCWYVLARDDEEAKVGNYIGGAQGDASVRRIWKERACHTFFSLCTLLLQTRRDAAAENRQSRRIENREVRGGVLTTWSNMMVGEGEGVWEWEPR